jgi:hypothetical protein
LCWCRALLPGAACWPPGANRGPSGPIGPAYERDCRGPGGFPGPGSLLIQAAREPVRIRVGRLVAISRDLKVRLARAAAGAGVGGSGAWARPPLSATHASSGNSPGSNVMPSSPQTLARSSHHLVEDLVTFGEVLSHDAVLRDLLSEPLGPIQLGRQLRPGAEVFVHEVGQRRQDRVGLVGQLAACPPGLCPPGRPARAGSVTGPPPSRRCAVCSQARARARHFGAGGQDGGVPSGAAPGVHFGQCSGCGHPGPALAAGPGAPHVHGAAVVVGDHRDPPSAGRCRCPRPSGPCASRRAQGRPVLGPR